MEFQNETRPLLPTFEGESWRSRTKKRCMRIPSEITITGIILGLFVIVVTLLIVFQNMDSENKDDISLGNNLLASPFKFNKKAEDQTWQVKKNDMKKNENNKEEKWISNKNQKWNKVVNGWKKFPDISGKIRYPVTKTFQKSLKDSREMPELPKVVDEYGKELEDSFETFFDLQMSDPIGMQQFNKDVTEIKNLLHTKLKWKDIDDGWKTLSEQGWSENSIRQALFKAIKEKRQELIDAASSLQSAVNVDDIWGNIMENWQTNVHIDGEKIGYSAFKKGKENKKAKYHKDVNDEWRNKMNILQSPKSSIKKFVKADDGWQKLSEQGWSNKDIEEAIIEAWKERENYTSLLQSPMNIQGLFGKATGFIKNIFHKGMSEQKSQKEINDEWANKFSLLQSPLSSYKKWKKIEDLKKKHSKDDLNDKTTHDNGLDQPPQSSVNIEDFIGDIIEKIKERKKGEEKSQKEINEEWAKEFSFLQSPLYAFKKWGKFEELKKKHSKDEVGKTTSRSDDVYINQVLQSPINFDGFMKDILDKIQEYKKGSKEAEKQKNINDEWKDNVGILQSSEPTDTKWNKVDDHWKTLIEHGWKDKDIKEAVYNAWKDANKHLQSATGYGNMKWKKVNEGWKKISNKS